MEIKTAQRRKGIGKKILYGILLALAAILLFLCAKRLFCGRFSGTVSGTVPELQISWEEANADGTVTQDEIAQHFAPEIKAAVNVLLSGSGKGDFLAAADYDGDLNAGNNWENMSGYPLNAVVYWSVQETETHYYIGYYFYHPRDDAEIWLDRHENDFEGIMLSVRRADDSFGTVEVMYTQGHGNLPFYFDDPEYAITEGSRYCGGLELNNDHPVIYITPNGTLNKAGHSVESAKDHTTYLYVGNSGVYYYNGGLAEMPSTFNGAYEKNPCSYALVSLQELYRYRNGPYGEGNLFNAFGEFYGDTWEDNAANPAWGWRNKTVYGFSGSYLSDPAWTVTKAVSGLGTVSHDYLINDYASYRVTVDSVAVSGVAEGTEIYVCIARDGWAMSNDSWWNASVTAGRTVYPVSFGDTNTVYIAAAADSTLEVYVCDGEGNRLPDTQATVSVLIEPLG